MSKPSWTVVTVLVSFVVVGCSSHPVTQSKSDGRAPARTFNAPFPAEAPEGDDVTTPEAAYDELAPPADEATESDEDSSTSDDRTALPEESVPLPPEESAPPAYEPVPMPDQSHPQILPPPE